MSRRLERWLLGVVMVIFLSGMFVPAAQGQRRYRRHYYRRHYRHPYRHPYYRRGPR